MFINTFNSTFKILIIFQLLQCTFLGYRDIFGPADSEVCIYDKIQFLRFFLVCTYY